MTDNTKDDSPWGLGPANIADFGIPESQLPKEYVGGVFENLDRLLASQTRRGLDDLYDSQEERGMFRSGQTEKRALEEVVFPADAARRKSVLDMVGMALGQQREERLGDVQFSRTKELAADEFERRLKEIELQAQQQRDLLRLQASLGIGVAPKKQSFWDRMGGSFASGFGQAAGMYLL